MMLDPNTVQVLFADLTPQDMAAMTAELDRQKLPYILSDAGGEGATIMVDRAEVYKTRLKLMGKDIPYVWFDRATWAIAAQAKVENFANPTTPAGGKVFPLIGGTIWPTQIWLNS